MKHIYKKTVIFFGVFTSFTFILHAQQKDKLIKPFDTSVLKLDNPKPVFLFNNNHFDIYKAAADNMFVIKPDSLNTYNMPVKLFQVIQIPILSYKQPAK